MNHNVNMQMFSVMLKKARERESLTQQEMAKELGISFNTYKNYETRGKGSREPDLETVAKIADILNVTIDFLFGRE